VTHETKTERTSDINHSNYDASDNTDLMFTPCGSHAKHFGCR